MQNYNAPQGAGSIREIAKGVGYTGCLSLFSMYCCLFGHPNNNMELEWFKENVGQYRNWFKRTAKKWDMMVNPSLVPKYHAKRSSTTNFSSPQQLTTRRTLQYLHNALCFLFFSTLVPGRPTPLPRVTLAFLRLLLGNHPQIHPQHPKFTLSDMLG